MVGRCRRSAAELVFKTWATATEPDPLPFFTGWSTGNKQPKGFRIYSNFSWMEILGRVMVVLWSVFMLLMICFLNSNLRANIILVSYEPDIDTVEDAFERYTCLCFKYVFLQTEGDNHFDHIGPTRFGSSVIICTGRSTSTIPHTLAYSQAADWALPRCMEGFRTGLTLPAKNTWIG